MTVDEVDEAMITLAESGRLRSGRMQSERSGKPLAGATINHYLSTLGSVYKFARRSRLVPRNHLSPARGIEKNPEPVDPDRYLRTEQIERIVACARVVDRKWRRLPALILVAFHSGLRLGSLQALRWKTSTFTLAGSCLVGPKTEIRSAPRSPHETSRSWSACPARCRPLSYSAIATDDHSTMAEVIASTIVQVQPDPQAMGTPITVVAPMGKIKSAVKTLEFSDIAKAAEPTDIDAGILTPSRFVGCVESFRRAARLRGESLDFADAARQVLQHIP